VTAENRLQGLTFALEHGPETITTVEAPDVIQVAELYRKYLDGTTVRIAVTAAVDGAGVPLKTLPGGTMPQIVNATVDNTTVTLTVLPADDHNNATSDTLVITNDDTAAVIADWVLSADTHTYTGTLKAVEGTVNIAINDPAAPSLSQTDVQLVVGPGATSQVQVTATVV
jgi:hypothetical protein